MPPKRRKRVNDLPTVFDERDDDASDAASESEVNAHKRRNVGQ